MKNVKQRRFVEVKLLKCHFFFKKKIKLKNSPLNVIILLSKKSLTRQLYQTSVFLKYIYIYIRLRCSAVSPLSIRYFIFFVFFVVLVSDNTLVLAASCMSNLLLHSQRKKWQILFIFPSEILAP